MDSNDDKPIYGSESKETTDIPELHSAIYKIRKREKTVDVQQPGCDLQRLWLHTVEPLLPIDVLHRFILAELACTYALRLCFTSRPPKCW